MRSVAWFQIVVGAAMLGLWSVLLAAGEVPELAAGQRDIVFHLGAELLTAIVLIVAGRTLLQQPGDRGHVLSGFALGALTYTTINSAGYYADRDEWLAVGMFLGLGTAAAVLFVRTVLRPASSRRQRTRAPG